MRAPHSPLPPWLGVAAAILAAVAAAAALHGPPQTYVVCKRANSHLCLAWPSTVARRPPERRAHLCGLTAGPLVPHRRQMVKLVGFGGANGIVRQVYCGAVLVGGEEWEWRRQRGGGGRRGRRQAPPPRGRYRGQTQSQYLAIERGAGDEGKAEALSAADSSRASVSGNSGMGQAQSQSMYDPSCDDCYGKNDAEILTSKKGPYGTNGNANSGYVPGRIDGQTWAEPGNRGGPAGSNPNSGSVLGTYKPLQPGIQDYQYYGVPGNNHNFAPSGTVGIGPERNENYSPGQGGISQVSIPGHGGSREPLHPDQSLTTGSFRPGQGPPPGYGPGQQSYAGYAPNQPISRSDHDNLPNKYGPTQNSGSENYAPGPVGGSGGEGYAPGSLINPPSRGPGNLGSIGINSGPQPNLIGSTGSYNQPRPIGNEYNRDEDTPPGNYKLGEKGVFSPSTGGSLPNSNSRNMISGGLGPDVSGGLYSPSQARNPSGFGSNIIPQGNGNANQGDGQRRYTDTPGGKNILSQPQGGNWPLASYSPGSSPYFCCVVGPDGNLIQAGASPYTGGHGVNNQYPNGHNLYGYERPMFSPGSNGQGYVPGLNNIIAGQQKPYDSVRPSPDTNTLSNNYGPRNGVLNENGHYRPPANLGSLPGSELGFRPGGSGLTGNGNYLNPNAGSGDGRGYHPGQSGSINEQNYKPGVGISTGIGATPGTDGGYVRGQNGAPLMGNYAPNQGNSGNVGGYVPGLMGTPGSEGVIGPGHGAVPNIGGAYGPLANIGKNVDGSYSPVQSTIPGSVGYNPETGGGSFTPQQSGSPGSNVQYGINPQGGPGGIGSYRLEQNPSGINGNYLSGPVNGPGEGLNYERGSIYGPGTGYIPGQVNGRVDNNFGSGPQGKPGTRESYGTLPHSGPGGNSFSTNPSGEPGSIQTYGPGQNIEPVSTSFRPNQNGNPNNVYGLGNVGPGQDASGNIGGYNPNQASGLGGKGTYRPDQNGMGQMGSYGPGLAGQPPIYGAENSNRYGGGPVENGYDQRYGGQNKEYNGVPQNFTDPNPIAGGDDSEAEASVSQAANGTIASASSRGGNDKGRAQTNVHGTYTGSGSFSAQAQITGENKEAGSEVSGGKKGASSSAQGSGRNNKSQANVQLGSETGSVQTQSLSNGAYHSSNSQVQGSIKGGMADAQARGPGSTSSQAQIGFTPYKDGDKMHDVQKIPFVGGGVASAQSSGRTGQSQSQLHGTFKYGITYNGAAQAGGSVDKDAVFPNRLTFDKIDVFDENEKNINVETASSKNPSTMEQSPSVDTVPPLESVPSEETLPSSDKTPAVSMDTDGTKVKNEETLKNSESRYSSHTHLDHHITGGQPTPPAATVAGATRSFQSNYDSNGPEYEYTTDREEVQPDEYDAEGAEVEQGEYANYDEIPRDTLTHQSLQSPRKTLEVKQTTGGNTQHIVLAGLDNHDAEITQRNSERPDEGKTYQPGERVPGTGGYMIPAGFTGSVQSVASKGNTYAVGSKESPSQAQTVTLTPGAGRVTMGGYSRPVGAGKLRSLRPDAHGGRYVSVSKSVARDLDAEDHVRKQYSHSYYTKSSSCGFFTFTCTMVSGAEGRKKVCRPKIPTNPDGTPIRC